MVAVAGGIGLEAGRIDNREARRRRIRRIVLGIHDQEVPGEEAVPRILRDHADRQTVSGVRTSVAVLHVHFRMPQRGEKIVVESVEIGRVHRAVDRAPCDLLFAARLAHEKLILWRPSGVLAGPAHERAFDGHQPFAAADRFFIQRGGRQIPFGAGAWNFLEFEGTGPFEA